MDFTGRRKQEEIERRIKTDKPNIRRILNTPYENRELHEDIELWREPELNSPYLYWDEEK